MENKFYIQFGYLTPIYLKKREFISWLKSNIFAVSSLCSDNKISLFACGYFCDLVFTDGKVFLRAIGDELNGELCGVNIKIK